MVWAAPRQPLGRTSAPRHTISEPLIQQLSQHPIKKNERLVHKSIIVKLQTIFDKNLIFISEKNLKNIITSVKIAKISILMLI